MLAITCSSCQKKLSVKDDLAGKKVKCPGCGQVTTVPSQTAPVGDADMRTMPPASNPGEQTISPKPVDASDTPTNPSLSKPDATQDAKNESSHDSSLTDFLAPPQADDELGRLGQYRILKILGHGGMGVVFLGDDPKLGRKVAIKAMLPHLAQSKSSQQRFLREARAAAALEHDHIVAIHHVDEDRGAPYIVMPFLKGQPLDERLKSGAALPLDEILRIGREVACALDAAHEAGLIHRDIKPANIWLEAPHARVKILDFGLARAEAPEAGLTQQGVIVGTPAYMAPEQGRGETVDHHCDLFSLGVVLYRLCTGKMPFHGKDSVSTLVAVAMHEPPAPIKINEKLPQELSDLVMKLLEKKPADRMSSAAEVIQLLHAIETKSAAAKMASAKVETLDAGEFRSGEPSGARGERANDAARFSDAVGSGGARRPVSRVAVALLALFGLLGFGAGGIYYWQTNNGIVKIEINDPDIKVAFDKNGPTITGVDKHDIKLTPGEFGLRVERGDLKFDTDKFILKRGETITLKIEWFKEGKLQVVQGEKVIGAKELPKAVVAVVPPGVGDKPKEGPTKPAPPATNEGPADPERKAAESLIPFADLHLELKSGKRTFIRSGGKLPSEPFKVIQIGFSRYYKKDLPATFVGTKLLPAIAELHSLTAIWNHFDQVETVTGEELARLSKMPAAKTINILALRFQLTSSAVDSLARFPSLHSLHCMAEQTDSATLGRLKELPKLKELSLLGLGKAGPISDKGIDDLCSMELTGIYIHSSTIVDARFAGKLANMPRVEHIDLPGSQVDDEIIAVLARGNAKLTTLNISGNPVTDAGLAHLKAKTTLRLLRVSFTKVTEAGARKLSDALPKCKIELGGGKVIGPKDKTAPPPVDPDDPTPEAVVAPLDSAWLTQVAAMKHAEQLDAAKAELVKRNRSGMERKLGSAALQCRAGADTMK